MLRNHRTRRTTTFLLTAVLLALPFGLSAQVASAQCADPRGNSYCQNGGQVTFNPPPGGPRPSTTGPVPNPKPPTNVNVQNPKPPRNVNTQNPNPPTNVNVQNPNPPTNVDVQNPNPPTNVDVQNPTGRDSGAQNPNAPIAIATPGQLMLSTDAAAPGDTIDVAGQGFGAGNLMFLNVVDSSGRTLSTDARDISCVRSDDFVVNIYQNRGYGCTSGDRAGPLNKSNPDGTFAGAIQIPSGAAPGPAQVCVQGVFATSCTTITISSSDG